MFQEPFLEHDVYHSRLKISVLVLLLVQDFFYPINPLLCYVAIVESLDIVCFDGFRP